ncbi:MAG: hypothetical protein H7270_15105 [Dermatophilaceae bacterium]|nr:hypothetical protein [Dermatophilaceae bacterium]
MESSSTGDDPAERSVERLGGGSTVEGDETTPTPHQILLDCLDEMVGSGALSTAERNGAG